jgi:hypothetical protein
LVKDIKGLAMMLSRFKPADWNKFLDVVIKWSVKADSELDSWTTIKINTGENTHRQHFIAGWRKV